MAKTTGSVKHTHKYFYMSSTGLWYCSGIDGCTHFMPKNMPPPVGRMSICWRCEKPFQMVQYHMENFQPKCDACMEALDKIDAYLDMGDPASVIPPKPVIRTSIVQSTSITRPNITPVQQTMEDDGHSVNCDVYIGGVCTCHLAQ
jgi:hypothetical protein